MGARVLLIDDDPVNRALMQRMLESYGHTSITACTGCEGVETAKAERPDLILIDVLLPDIDGMEVARRIRLVPALRATPLVAMSASTWDEGEVGRAGFVSHVFKPVDDLVVFMRQIHELVS